MHGVEAVASVAVENPMSYMLGTIITHNFCAIDVLEHFAMYFSRRIRNDGLGSGENSNLGGQRKNSE